MLSPLTSRMATPLRYLVLHHPQLLAQVTVDLQQLLDLRLRGVESSLDLHELLDCDWAIRQVRRFGALKDIGRTTSNTSTTVVTPKERVLYDWAFFKHSS